MGTISSGIGLVSGIDIDSLVSQLMAVEARPRILVERRLGVLQSQKTAFLDINARLLALGSSASALGRATLFNTKKAVSSDTSVLTAAARTSAALGNYSIAVSRLVSTHQLITRGFADTDTTPLGAGTIRLESHRARLDGDVRLADLNGQAGVQRGVIRITDRGGASADIDLTRAVALDDVLRTINASAAVNVTASIDGDGLKLTDHTGQTVSDLIVQDLGATATAADLGLAGNSAGADTITGSQINLLSDDVSLRLLNDGLGVRTLGSGQPDLRLTRGGQSFDVDLAGAATLGDVIDAINDHPSNTGVTASIGDDGVSLKLTGSGDLSVAALSGSGAAADLGIDGLSGTNTITGERLLAALGSKLLRNLNGGSGVTAGTIDITNRAGATTSVDLSAARSVSDVIDTINASGAGVTASLNAAGHGVLLTDTTGASASNLIVADVSGTLAADLGLATDPAGVDAETLDGGDRDLRYISESTRLDALNGGEGVAAGRFTLTDSAGVTATVDLTQGDETTLGKVIDEINSRPTSIVASINASGDGILLTDTAGGALKMTIEEAGSTTARDLGILATDDDGDGLIDGSFEKAIDITATDTLDDVVEKINSAGVFVTASIINDGSATSPFRLNLTSTHSGAAGRILFDDGGLDLRASTLVRGRDAVALLGSADPAEALLITSSTNTLANTIPGVSIDLLAASDQPVQLTIDRDDEAVLAAVRKFVEDFNGVLDTLDKYDRFNAETLERGLLLGDSTVGRVRRQLLDLSHSRMTGVAGQFQFLSQVGLSVRDGARLQLDEDRFRDALTADPSAVASLFNAATTAAAQTVDLPPGVSIPDAASETERAIGFAKRLKELVDGMTDSAGGAITLRTDGLDRQVRLANDRIDRLNQQLDAKRARLLAQFHAMEQALAQLQAQQSALAGLSLITLNTGGNRGGGALGGLL